MGNAQWEGSEFRKLLEKFNHLMQAIRIHSQSTGMEFGIEVCTMLMMKSRKKETMEGIVLLYQESTRRLERKRK